MAELQPSRYGAGARAFHWLVFLLIVVQIPVGIAMTSEGFPSIGNALFILHKAAGPVLLVVIAARVVWRLTHPAPPMPSYVPAVEQRIAGLTHIAIYVLLVVMPVSGYIRTVGDGFPLELLELLGIPPLLPRMPEIARLMRVVHAFTAYTLTALIALHIGAVMYHFVILRDGVMWRIWPPVGREDPRIGREPRSLEPRTALMTEPSAPPAATPPPEPGREGE